MKNIFLLFFIAFLSAGCEKDDICDANTETTPELVIGFYDFNNPTVPKNVNQLKVTANGQTEALQTFNGVNTISIPLSITGDSVQYSFNINSTDTDFANTDILTFNYTRENVFVSRACGYKTLFTLAETNPFVLTPEADPADRWMTSILVSQPNIETEDDTHIKIYF